MDARPGGVAAKFRFGRLMRSDYSMGHAAIRRATLSVKAWLRALPWRTGGRTCSGMEHPEEP